MKAFEKGDRLRVTERRAGVPHGTTGAAFPYQVGDEVVVEEAVRLGEVRLVGDDSVPLPYGWGASRFELVEAGIPAGSSARLLVRRTIEVIERAEAALPEAQAELIAAETRLNVLNERLATLRADLAERVQHLAAELTPTPDPAEGARYCLLDGDGDWWFTDERGDWWYTSAATPRGPYRAANSRARGLAGAEGIIDTYGVRA